MTSKVVNTLLESADRYTALARLVSDAPSESRFLAMAAEAERLAQALSSRPGLSV